MVRMGSLTNQARLAGRDTAEYIRHEKVDLFYRSHSILLDKESNDAEKCL